MFDSRLIPIAMIVTLLWISHEEAFHRCDHDHDHGHDEDRCEVCLVLDQVAQATTPEPDRWELTREFLESLPVALPDFRHDALRFLCEAPRGPPPLPSQAQ